MARPIKEQFPCIGDELAAALDADSLAMSRLAVRGYLTEGQKASVVRRIAAAVSKAIQDAPPT